MTVIFLFPCDVHDAWDPGALRCLSWKRSNDLWSVLHYSETPERTDCTGFWSAVHRAVLPGNSPVRGARHMIVLAPEDAGNCSEDEVIAAVHASGTSIEVLSPTANPGLREFCSRVKARFHLLEDMASAKDLVSLAYLSLLARYEIRYQPVSPDATSLKLRVQTPAGWGETMVPLPESHKI
jgi:hypothetical protein